MKGLFGVALVAVLFGLAGFAGADDKDDNAKKIVGKWEVTKSGSDVPVGSTVTFSKDGKINVAVKLDGKDESIDGTYKVEKDKLTVKLKVADQTIEETLTLQKLTDKELEIKDKDGKVDVLKKVK